MAETPRHEISLNAGWRTAAEPTGAHELDGFEQPSFDVSHWKTVDVPHNWDDYGGEHRIVHGNLHGTASYRRTFAVPAEESGRRVFLFFEGVGSYATVWVNGRLAGKHAGGRTTFTLDVTSLVHFGASNVLAVRADHPAGITDLPWVCGGCSEKPGFSEGSQPMGIFRPVHMITTNDVRVTPFGVHVWNDADATADRALVHVTTELVNDGAPRTVTVRTRIRLAPKQEGRAGVRPGEGAVATAAISPEARSSPAGTTIPPGQLQRRKIMRVPEAEKASGQVGPAGESVEQTLELRHVALWSPNSPTLYVVETTIRDGDRVLDQVTTPFGIRTIQWPAPTAAESAPFRLNGQPVFINGTCEYEHLLGASHAFSAEQIRARVAQFHAAGFNAFRDAHQPHNLRYQEYWDRDGVLWWPQFAAQIWYDTPEFRENFKALLRDWVRERRNSPSLVLWGLANESKLPPDFAAECVAIIRQLDPTSPSQRLVTTCNSGKGTDWNVPQNWSGTYGGKPNDYANDLLHQRLVGEYGAWRSLGLHSEGGFVAKGARSEDRAAALLELKIRLGESVRDRVAGHFQWLLATHDNPGRAIGSEGQQGADGWDGLDRIGPANNKGLFTLWGEPTDLFYLYRSNYAPATRDPMVYIVSHTWPDRWKEPGRKNGIVVYSNCDEVELFNDVGTQSLGVRRRAGIGTHFQWDDVPVNDDVLYAEGRVAGKVVARDLVQLRNLPAAPHLAQWSGRDEALTAGAPGQNYLYRVNCGGADYTDEFGQHWVADRDYAQGSSWGSVSWAMAFPDVPARFGSQRELTDVVSGTRDQALFATYRYGREKLRYRFRVSEGDYRIELYFVEPWYGTGGGDCAGWRLFDVAVNDRVVLRDVDLWQEAGYAHAVRKVVQATARDGWLEVSFPRVASYQAVVSAIAVSTSDPAARAPQDMILLTDAERGAQRAGPSTATPQTARSDAPALADEHRRLSDVVYPATAATRAAETLTWAVPLGLGGAHEFALRYSNASTQPVTVHLTVKGSDGSIAGEQKLTLLPTKPGEERQSAVAALGMNAGDYTVTVSLPAETAVGVVALVVR